MSCSFLSNYRWSLYVGLYNGSNHSWKEIENLANISLTSLTGPSLVIGRGDISHKKSALLRNKTYKIHIVAWLDEENYQEDSYIFQTNVPPSTRAKDDGCFVDPKIGEAITTEFTVECINWTDTDLPLTYQFSYETQFGIVVFHAGQQPNVTTELPIGNQMTNYSLQLQLEIIDSFGDYSVVFITVQVIFAFFTKFTIIIALSGFFPRSHRPEEAPCSFIKVLTAKTENTTVLILHGDNLYVTKQVTHRING